MPPFPPKGTRAEVWSAAGVARGGTTGLTCAAGALDSVAAGDISFGDTIELFGVSVELGAIVAESSCAFAAGRTAAM